MILAPFWGDDCMAGCPGPPGPPGPEGPQGPPGSAVTDTGIFKSLSDSVTGSGTFQNKIDQSASLVGGTYYVVWSVAFTADDNNTNIEFQVEADGNVIETFEASNIGHHSQNHSRSSFDLVDLPTGMVNFKLDFRQSGGGGNVTISYAKIAYILAIPLGGGVGGLGNGGGGAA